MTKKKRKTKKIGGTKIEEADIMYQDELVCILHPEVKKGIIVFTSYNQPHTESLCNLGLKTGKLLHEEGVYFYRGVFHPYIFFKAPYYANTIDYSTPEREIISSYGEGIIIPGRVFIRVDPEKTFVFSSEIRALYNPPLRVNSPEYLFEKERKVNLSKKTLSKYLDIIKQNETVKGYDFMYHLYSSLKVPKREIVYPFDTSPINRNSEILVSLPHLTPDYFVLCTETYPSYNESQHASNSQKRNLEDDDSSPKKKELEASEPNTLVE